MSKRKRFGEILLDIGVITERDLEKALDRQRITKQPLGQIFEQLGIICEKDILRILASQFNLKEIERIKRPVQFDDLIRIIDGPTALTKKVFPLGVKGGRLYLATSNPLDLANIDSIAFRTGLQVIPFLATPTEIDGAIRRYYLGEPEPQKGGPCKVLVVDNQELYRKTIAANMQKAGYAVLEADNGTDALKKVLGRMPHLILLETSLQGMSGKHVFRTLQTNSMTRQIPVIGLSTRSYPEEEALLLDMGFFDFVAKPFNFTRLMARIRRALTFCEKHSEGGEQGKGDAPRLPPCDDWPTDTVDEIVPHSACF